MDMVKGSELGKTCEATVGSASVAKCAQTPKLANLKDILRGYKCSKRDTMLISSHFGFMFLLGLIGLPKNDNPIDLFRPLLMFAELTSTTAQRTCQPSSVAQILGGVRPNSKGHAPAWRKEEKKINNLLPHEMFLIKDATT